MRVFVSLLVLGVTFLLTACDKPQQAALDFLEHDGQPISPYCFAGRPFAGDDNVISLKDCTEEHRKRFDSEFDTFDGRYLQKMKPLTDNDDHMYFASKYIGGDENAFAIEMMMNTGGTGIFSHITIFKREGDTLRRVEAYSGGDRCHGGLTGESTYKNGVVAHSQSLTPIDMFNIEGYDIPIDIDVLEYEFCAVCCVASVNYKNDELVDYTLIAEDIARNSNPEGFSEAQDCLNKHMKEATKGKDKTFSPKAFRAFLAKADKACRPHLY